MRVTLCFVMMACLAASSTMTKGDKVDVVPTFSEVERLLQDGEDPGWPVVVSRRKLQTNWAWTKWSDADETFLVVVHEGPERDPVANESLVHEWAHVLVWDACQESLHDALWGVAYARCYRAVHGDDDE